MSFVSLRSMVQPKFGSNTFPTKKDMNDFLKLQKERANAKNALAKLYRYDIPDEQLNEDTVRMLIKQNKNINHLKRDGVSGGFSLGELGYSFKEWVESHKGIKIVPFKFEISNFFSVLLFKYKDVIIELEITIIGSDESGKPIFKIYTKRFTAWWKKRGTAKRAVGSNRSWLWNSRNNSNDGEPFLFRIMIWKILSDMIGDVERLQWEGVLSPFWTKSGGKCEKIFGLCEKINETNYRFNSKVLHKWSNRFLKEWNNDGLSRVQRGDTYKKVVEDITDKINFEIDKEKKTKDKSYRTSIVEQGMPCLCRKKQRGSGKKKRRRKTRRRKYKHKTRRKKK